MVDQLQHHQSQVVTIKTEEPWGLWQNGRSYRLLHNIFQKIIYHNLSISVPIIVVGAEVGWDFTQNTSLEIPHLLRLGALPRILGYGLDTSLQQCIDLIEIIRVGTDHIRTTQLFARIFSP